jgi:hypothetical protein
VHAGADAIGGQHLALEIGDGRDAGILFHHVVGGEVVLAAVLDLVGDDAQVGESGVLHGKRKARETERGDLQLADRHGGDLRRRGAEIDRLEHVGFPLVPGETLLGEQDRNERGGRDHPSGTDFHGFRARVSHEHDGDRGRNRDVCCPSWHRPSPANARSLNTFSCS